MDLPSFVFFFLTRCKINEHKKSVFFLLYRGGRKVATSFSLFKKMNFDKRGKLNEIFMTLFDIMGHYDGKVGGC
jgi:hypothetical protein|uniref:Uncharacterized protein n=1 Tax=Halalkalibacterium halodurans TaxID=86665 RepID=A0A0M0KHT0_ALKHA